MIAFKSNSLVKTLRNETSVLIEVKPNVKNDLTPQLAAIPGAVQSTIRYTSREDAKRLMERELGAAFLDIEGENPFYDTYQLNISKDQLNLELIKRMPEVKEAYAQTSYVDQIQTNVRKFSRLALVIGVFFSILAFTLIFNAIKLSLAESKTSFYTLKLLGSDWNFIKRPFLQRAFYSGLLSGGIAVLLFIIAIIYLMYSNQTIQQIVSVWNIVLVAIIMLLVGFLVNLLSTNAILNRFLAMREEDLYS